LDASGPVLDFHPLLSPREIRLPPYLRGKVFLPKTREWKEARARELEPGQEFVADNRFFKVLSRDLVVECPEIDVSKLPDADRPFDTANCRPPRETDVVYLPSKDGRYGGHCLLANVERHKHFRFQGRYYFLQLGEELGSMHVINTGRVDRPEEEDDDRWLVWLEYTIEDALGKAEVGYYYPLGQLIPLTNGAVRPVEDLQPGEQFVLEAGDSATVTKVGEPVPPLERPPDYDLYGLAERRIRGTFQFTGWVQMIEVVWGGEIHHMTPGHLFWSESRRGWYPIGTFVAGELLRSRDRRPIPIEAITPPRWCHETVYNREVDQYHTYFVGKFGVWAHNGMGEQGCGVPKAADARRQRQIPQENGYWSTSPKKGGPKNGAPGESYWHSTDPRVTGHPDYKPIKFTNRYPDFAPFTLIRVEAQLTGKPGSGDHKAAAKALARMLMADPSLAEQLGIPAEAYTRGTTVMQPYAKGVLKWMKAQPNGGLTWHHSTDMTSMLMMPTDIHSVSHAGGADLLRQAAGIRLNPERWRTS
jgi:hypothetical protein